MGNLHVGHRDRADVLVEIVERRHGPVCRGLSDPSAQGHAVALSQARWLPFAQSFDMKRDNSSASRLGTGDVVIGAEVLPPGRCRNTDEQTS